MKKYTVTTLVAILLLASPALAATTKNDVPECEMKDNVFVAVNFTSLGKSNQDAKKKFDEKVQQISDLTKQAEVKRIVNLTWNYTINEQVNSYENGYQDTSYLLLAAGNYQVDTLDNAFKLSEALISQKFKTAVTVQRSQKPDCVSPFN